MTNANDFAYPMTDITSCATAKGLTKREYIATCVLAETY